MLNPPPDYLALLWEALATVANASLPAAFIGLGVIGGLAVLVHVLERAFG